MFNSLIKFCLIIAVVFCTDIFCDRMFDKLFQEQNYIEALEYVDKTISPQSRSASLWVKIALANEKLGLVEKALASYLISLRKHPKDFASVLGAARIYNNLKQYDNALPLTKRAIEHNLNYESSWEYTRACIALKKTQDAKIALEKIIENTDSNSVANKELGKIYFYEKKYVKSIDLLNKSYKLKSDPHIAYLLGQSYIETGDTTTALYFLKMASDLKKDNYQAVLLIARIAYKQDRFEDAAALYSAIVSHVSLSMFDNFYFACSMEKSGNNNQAYERYKSVIASAGNNSTKESAIAQYKVGIAEKNKKNYSGALKRFIWIEESKYSFLKNSEFYILFSDTYSQLKNYKSAILILEKALTIDSTNVVIYAHLASLYSFNNMPDKVKKTYEKMASVNPKDYRVFLKLGNLSYKKKDYSKALELFIKSNALEQNIDALEGLALSAAALGQWEKVLNASESAVRLNKDRIKIRMLLAKALLRNESYDQAKIHLEVVVNKYPKDKESWIALAQCYEKLHNENGLLEADKNIITLDSKNITSRMRLAQHWMGKEDLNAAHILYTELLYITPVHADVYKYLYEIAEQKKDMTMAIQYLQKYLNRNPKDGLYQKRLGDLFYAKKNYKGAFQAYKKALDISPKLQGANKRYAELVYVKGNYSEAIRALNLVVQTSEADAGTYKALGEIYRKKGSFANAIEQYNKALQLDPKNSSILSQLGYCYERIGDIKNAVISYEQSVLMNLTADREFKSLGDLYFNQKQFTLAMQAYDTYFKHITNDYETMQRVGNYYYDKKDYEKAIHYLSKVSGKQGYNFQHRLKLGQAYFYANKSKKAALSFASLLKRKIPSAERRSILYLQAQAYEKLGDTTSALKAYDRYSVIKWGTNKDVDFKRAYFREKKQPDLAKKIYEKNIIRYPKDGRNYLQLGSIHGKKRGTSSYAIVLLKKAMKLNNYTNAKKIWFDIARICKTHGLKKQEMEAYKNYLTLDPHDIEANIHLGKILLKDGRVSESLLYFETANTLTPNTIELISTLTHIYLNMNRLTEASILLSRAKKLNLNAIAARKLLCKIYLAQGNLKLAKAEIADLLKLGRDEEILLLDAELLVHQNEFKDALSTTKEIRQKNPKSIDALMLEAKIHRYRKHYVKAIDSYKSVLLLNYNFAPALYGRAETYALQKKYRWAIQFYQKTANKHPKSGLAELSLAKIAKLKNNKKEYILRLKNAKKLDPGNTLIQEEFMKMAVTMQ